jgi:hypothetical protein
VESVAHNFHQNGRVPEVATVPQEIGLLQGIGDTLRYDQSAEGDLNMPSAVEVVPKKWSKIRVLFDNGRYSVISGVFNGFDEGPRRVLGERWNGDAKRPLGFPNVARYPVWHVVPKFLEIPILQGVRDDLAKHVNSQNRQYSAEVLSELQART